LSDPKFTLTLEGSEKYNRVPVKDFWWEGDDLVARTEDGDVLRFVEAEVKSIKNHYSEGESLKVEEMDLEYEPMLEEVENGEDGKAN
jgi:hypothetical protein